MMDRRVVRIPCLVAIASVLAIVCPGRAAAQNSTIVYQCGASGDQICSIDPADGAAQTLTQTGDLAGLTADGTTYAYQPSAGGIWEAPVAGGAPTEVNDNQLDSPILVMSPDGQSFISSFDDVELGDFVSQINVSAGPSSTGTALDYDEVPAMTYGWLGETPLTTHSGDGPTSWVCIGGQTADVSNNVTYCGSNAPTALIKSSTNYIVFPSGSPDGTEIAAVVAPEGDFIGSIELFSATTGAYLSTVATPPAGSGYSVPRFSPDGSQIVFESDPTSGNGPSSIDVVNTDGTGLQTIASGTDPFWGAAPAAPSPTPGPSPGPTPKPTQLPWAAKVSISVPSQALPGVRDHRRLAVRCALAGAGRCTVRVTISARFARQLRLKVSRRARTVTLAIASTTFKRRGRALLTLRLSAAEVTALRRARSIRLTLTATSQSAHHRARTSSRTITLR